MKRILIIAGIWGISISAIAQTTGNKRTIDNASIRCYYLFNKKKEATDKAFRSDTMVLYIGAKASKFYDPARLGRDSMLTAKIKNMDTQTIKSMNIYKADSGKDFSNMPGTTSSSTAEGESYQIIKDKLTHKINVLDYPAVMGDRFQYEDELGTLPWKISDNTDTIASYVCQSATLTFRGRDYKAWFTTDIPVNDGPWKFSGLPGLILKIEDTKDLFSFTLIGLEQLKVAVPIQIDDAKAIKCSRADFEKLRKKQGGGMQINFNAGNVIIAETAREFEYIPMEIE